MYIWINSNILLLGFELNATLSRFKREPKRKLMEIKPSKYFVDVILPLALPKTYTYQLNQKKQLLLSLDLG
ncbi:MAG: hypothetical protein CM15mP122_4720 [Bacteroidota bacterium]|nr:MAG: hypothetical protein CM15mP122_4720 [Bacteroidota bacterium]